MSNCVVFINKETQALEYIRIHLNSTNVLILCAEAVSSSPSKSDVTYLFIY